MKYRGQAFRGGYHDYAIRRGGLEVYPRLVQGRIAAQRHDMADADVPIVADHGVDLFARRVNAGEMRGGLELRLLQHAGDRGVGALTGGTTGAIGDGNIARP